MGLTHHFAIAPVKWFSVVHHHTTELMQQQNRLKHSLSHLFCCGKEGNMMGKTGTIPREVVNKFRLTEEIGWLKLVMVCGTFLCQRLIQTWIRSRMTKTGDHMQNESVLLVFTLAKMPWWLTIIGTLVNIIGREGNHVLRRQVGWLLLFSASWKSAIKE